MKLSDYSFSQIGLPLDRVDYWAVHGELAEMKKGGIDIGTRLNAKLDQLWGAYTRLHEQARAEDGGPIGIPEPPLLSPTQVALAKARVVRYSSTPVSKSPAVRVVLDNREVAFYQQEAGWEVEIDGRPPMVLIQGEPGLDLARQVLEGIEANGVHLQPANP